MTTRVTVNDLSIAKWLNRDPAMQGILRKNAVSLMETSKANAPRKTGYFYRRFKVRHYRYWYRMENVDPFAHLVEWGSVNNPTYAPIRRAIRASRLRYIPNPDSRGA